MGCRDARAAQGLGGQMYSLAVLPHRLALVDINNAYVSMERVFQPQLEGVLVVVKT